MTKEPTPPEWYPNKRRIKVPTKKPIWCLPQEVPPTRITIHHEFDNTLHFSHKLNVTIRNINAAVKLIFKNKTDSGAMAHGATGPVYQSQWTAVDEQKV